MDTWLRVSARLRDLRRSVWVVPAISVAAALTAGWLLPSIPVETDDGVAVLLFEGSADGARAVLSAVASSTITVTGLTFSLTVVALQMASSQMTPRIMRTFLSDRGNQAVLATFLATFAYSLAVLRVIRGGSAGGPPGNVPRIAVTVAFLLALVSVLMLVYFIHHITQQLRVEVVLQRIESSTLDAVEHRLAHPGGTPMEDLPSVPEDAGIIRARRSGYLQMVEVDRLAGTAVEHGVVVVLRPEPGDHVTAGSTLAWVWPVGESEEPLDPNEELAHAVHRTLHVDHERTLDQDVEFGLRQLVDIGAKALSPGINDPTTAVTVIGHLSVILCRVADEPLGPIVRWDDEGNIRAVSPAPRFEQLLQLACGQMRRYGAGEGDVVVALLRMLADVAECCTGEDRRASIRARIDEVEHAAMEGTASVDREWIGRAADVAREASVRGHRPQRIG